MSTGGDSITSAALAAAARVEAPSSTNASNSMPASHTATITMTALSRWRYRTLGVTLTRRRKASGRVADSHSAAGLAIRTTGANSSGRPTSCTGRMTPFAPAWM